MAALLFVGLALYFVVRGALNAALVLVFLHCAVRLAMGRITLPRPMDAQVAWMIVALAAPFVAVLAVQLLTQAFVPRYFDAAARLLMAALLLVCFLPQRVNFVRLLEHAFPPAVLLCAAMIFLYPGASAYFWTGRFASYFMDPLTLAQHITIAGFICLILVDATGRDPAWQRALKYSAFVAALAISLGTHSRTGWIMVPLLAAVWLIGVKRNTRVPRVCAALAAVAGACLAAYWASDVVQGRVDLAIKEALDYFRGGDRDTSVGVRLTLARVHWLLFLQDPLHGWGFGSIPRISSVPAVAAFSTPLVEHFFLVGGHSEWMQSMFRMGLFGLLSRGLLLLVPLVVFAKAAASRQQLRRTAGCLGLTVVLGYLAAGLTTEVFNLIYAASFYGVLVAGLAAAALSHQPE